MLSFDKWQKLNETLIPTTLGIKSVQSIGMAGQAAFLEAKKKKKKMDDGDSDDVVVDVDDSEDDMDDEDGSMPEKDTCTCDKCGKPKASLDPEVDNELSDEPEEDLGDDEPEVDMSDEDDSEPMLMCKKCGKGMKKKMKADNDKPVKGKKKMKEDNERGAVSKVVGKGSAATVGGVGGAIAGGLVGGPIGAAVGGIAGAGGGALMGMKKKMKKDGKKTKKENVSLEDELGLQFYSQLKENPVPGSADYETEFFKDLESQFGNPNERFSDGVELEEEVLIAPAGNEMNDEPSAGESGFAPEGRIGSITGNTSELSAWEKSWQSITHSDIWMKDSSLAEQIKAWATRK